jgi:hypothetical protein
MPKYTNTTTDLIVKGDLRIEAGQTIETRQWLSPLPAGVTKLADAPYDDPIILSQAIATGTVAIPVGVTGNYKISVFVVTGTITMKQNSASATARIFGTGEQWSAICLSRTIDSLIFAVSGGAGSITVERI